MGTGGKSDGGESAANTITRIQNWCIVPADCKNFFDSAPELHRGPEGRADPARVHSCAYVAQVLAQQRHALLQHTGGGCELDRLDLVRGPLPRVHIAVATRR